MIGSVVSRDERQLFRGLLCASQEGTWKSILNPCPPVAPRTELVVCPIYILTKVDGVFKALANIQGG
jgi:hypothetical protein